MKKRQLFLRLSKKHTCSNFLKVTIIGVNYQKLKYFHGYRPRKEVKKFKITFHLISSRSEVTFGSNLVWCLLYMGIDAIKFCGDWGRGLGLELNFLGFQIEQNC